MSNANTKISDAAIAAGAKITKVPAKAKVAQTKIRKAKSAKAKVTPAVQAEGPKCAQGRVQIGKLQRRMLTKITKIGKKPPAPNRLKRWENYKVGQTLQHCKATDGLDHLDIGFYVAGGFMEVTPCTDKEYEAALAAQAKVA